MFKQNTVFVLGAGASWHYGYPTGEGLVDHIKGMSQRVQSHCQYRLGSGHIIQYVPKYVENKLSPGNDRAAAWQAMADDCSLLVSRLNQINPVMIDSFLAWNESLRLIGKLMIAASILECEASWSALSGNQNRRLILENTPMKPSDDQIARLDVRKYHDDWYRFIIHKLVQGCLCSNDLQNNDVRFITFNYDTSLEHRLYNSLKEIDMFQLSDVKQFLTNDRIVHVYGAIHELLPTEDQNFNLATIQNIGRASPTPTNYEEEFGQ